MGPRPRPRARRLGPARARVVLPQRLRARADGVRAGAGGARVPPRAAERPPDVKVVDVAIARTLQALAERGAGDVLLASHDGDFAEPVAALLHGGGRRVGLLAFRELVSGALLQLASEGLEVFDLEDDVGAFTVALPRVRVIPIEQFDPWALLG